jgi:hypothetical protein
MVWSYGVAPGSRHLGRLVAALGRGGHLASAKIVAMGDEIIAGPGFGFGFFCFRHCPPPPAAIWLALLSACHRWNNVQLARTAFDRLLQS